MRIRSIKDQSMSSNVTSLTHDITRVTGWSAQFIFSGSPVGTIKIQGTSNGIDFDDLPGAQKQISSAGDFTFNLTYRAQYPYIRTLFVRTSGTGTLNVIVSGKEK